MKEAEDTPKSEIAATEISDYTIVEGTIAEVNVAANLNKVVKITGAEFKANKTVSSSTEAGTYDVTSGKLTLGDAAITVNNGGATANQQLHKLDVNWQVVVNESQEITSATTLENVTIVAILVATSATAQQLLPITMTGTSTGIQDINADVNADDVKIYNLQGVRLNSLQKGVNIVNGKKIVVK